MILQRIEEALTRLEAAARQPEVARVEATNARLREAVALSLRQIDALVSRHGADGQL